MGGVGRVEAAWPPSLGVALPHGLSAEAGYRVLSKGRLTPQECIRTTNVKNHGHGFHPNSMRSEQQQQQQNQTKTKKQEKKEKKEKIALRGKGHAGKARARAASPEHAGRTGTGAAL